MATEPDLLLPSSVVDDAEAGERPPSPLANWDNLIHQPASSPRHSAGHESDTTTTQAAPISLPTYVYYGNVKIKVRIDSNVPLLEIVNQLVSSQQLNIREAPSLFCLRDLSTDELVTDANIFRLLSVTGAAFKLVSSPVVEAAEMVDKLGTKDDKTVKLATFELKRLVQERIFVDEFISRGGLIELVSVIESASGNTLSYALASLQSLMETDAGWEDLDEDCLSRIIHIFSSQSLINIARPAMAILRKLILADPINAPPTAAYEPHNTNTIYNYGFPRLWPLIQNERGFWPAVTRMLATNDQMTVIQCLGLINALLRGATDQRRLDFAVELENAKVRQDVLHLCDIMGDSVDVAPLINVFEVNLVKLLHLLLQSPVHLEDNSQQKLDLNRGFLAALPGQNVDASDTAGQLQALGFVHESGEPDATPFSQTGLLGFGTFIAHLESTKDDLSRLIVDHQKRTPDRRCPIGAVSNVVMLHLADVWNISQGELLAGPSELLPLLLNYQGIHLLGIKLFVRLWAESFAATGDFDRISSLVGTQLKLSLRNESHRTWFDVERELQHTPYQEIRDKQMSELALEDELLSKAPIRNLRARLYQESFSFIRNQRIQCLQEGAWFLHSMPAVTKEQKRSTQQGKTWRFYRLAANKKHLHFLEAAERIPIRAGIEDLPERIELNLVTDIISSSTLAQASAKSPLSPTNSATGSIPPPTPRSLGSSTTFALYTASGCIAELTAADAQSYSEWIDGLSMLKPNGYISTKETADLIQALTEVGVKIKLLDLTGEQVQIPQNIQVTAIPASRNYHYADL